MALIKLAVLAALGMLSCTQTPPRLELAPDPTKQCNPPQIVLRKPGTNYPPNATYQNNAAPPVRYRGDRQIQVQFAPPEEVERLCGNGRPICGFKIMACQKGGKLIMPNPCGANSVVEPYGKLLCHELAHANGWPAFHGD